MAIKQKKESVQLKIRVESELQQALEKAATERGVSMNREITNRLWRSLAGEASEDRRMFFSRELHGIMELLAICMQNAGHAAGTLHSSSSIESKGTWIDDPYSYAQALKAAIETLKAIQPVEVPPPIKDESVGSPWDQAIATVNAELGLHVARGIIADVVIERQRHASGRVGERLRADLGDALIKRLLAWLDSQPKWPMSKQPETTQPQTTNLPLDRKGGEQ